jgi:DNA-binding FrmR family transcriptional regulator
MKHSEKVIKRLKTAKGHLRRVIKMVEEEQYCIDILQQSLAVQAALKRADEEILADHLSHCVKGVLSNKDKDKQLGEILEVFKKGRI